MIVDLLRNFIRLIVASVGLVKDRSEDAIRGYLGLLKRMAVPTLIALAISALLAMAAVVSDVKLLNVASVAVGGAVAMLWVVVTAPFIAVGTKIAEFEFLKPTLGFLQFVAGSAFFLSLLAMVVPADAVGVSRLTLAAVSLAGSLFVFGLTQSLHWLRVKVGAILVLLLLAMVFPSSASVAPKILTKIDTMIAGLIVRFTSDSPTGRTAPTESQATSPAPDLPTTTETEPRPQDLPSPREPAMTTGNEAVPAFESGTQPVGDASLTGYVKPGASPPYLAVAIALDSGFDRGLMERVRERVQAGLPRRVSSDVFSDSIIADGVFGRILAGDQSLARSWPSPVADYLALGRARIREETSGVTQSPVVDLSVEMRIINGQTGAIVAKRQFKHRAIGYSPDEALDTARTEASDEISTWVLAEMARL